MIDQQLKSIIDNIPNIPSTRRYWFVRSDGGFYYNSFLSENVISIGFDDIKLSDIAQITNDTNLNTRKAIEKMVKEKYPDYKRPGLAASQLIRFYSEIKNGDIVIVPSYATYELSFGEITDDKPRNISFFKADQNKDLTYNKARSVKWLKTLKRKELSPDLFSLFFSHQTICNGDEYAHLIDSTLNDCYIKNNKLHLQLKIQKSSNINARQLFYGCLHLLDLTDEFLSEHKYEGSTADIDTKIRLNSPGTVELIGYGFAAMTVLGLLTIGLVGGGFKAKFGENTIEMKTDGVIKKLIDFIRERHRQNTVDRILNTLEVKDPKELADIAKKLLK